MDMDIRTEAGKMHLEGTLSDRNRIMADLRLEDAHLEAFMDGTTASPVNLSATASLQGDIKGAGNRPSIHATGHIQSLTFHQHTYHDIPFNASAQEYDYDLGLQIHEEQGEATLEAHACLPPAGPKSLDITGDLVQFNPSALHLTEALANESITGKIQAQLAMHDAGQPEGDILITGLSVSDPDKGTLDIGDIHLSCHSQSGYQQVRLQSDIVQMEASGTFRWKMLPFM